MSTHILATAEKYCDRFVVLHNGEIRADGSLEMLRKRISAAGFFFGRNLYCFNKGAGT